MRRHLPLMAVLGAGLLLRLWGISFGLPHTLIRPDEDAVMSIAMRFFSRDLNPGFFDWPSLFMYVVALGYVLYFNFGRLTHAFPYESSFLAAASVNPAPLYLIARGLGVVTGVLTIAGVYRIGTLLFDRSTALVGALFLSVAALHVRDSHFGVTDVAATFLLTESFLFTLRATVTGSRRHLLLSAMLAGLAASTKYNAGLVVLPAVWAMMTGLVPTLARWPDRITLFTLYGLVAAAAFLAGTPFALLEPQLFLTGLGRIAEHLQAGHTAMAGYGWQVHLSSSLRYGLGLPMLLAGIAGLALYFRQGWRKATLFAMFPVAYFLLVGSGQTAFARYIIPVVPFLCIAAAYTTSSLAALIAAHTNPLMRHGVVVGALAAAIAAPSAWSAIQTNRLLARTDNRLLAAEWIREHYPAGAHIHQAGASYTWVQMQTSDAQAAERYPRAVFDASNAQFTGANTLPLTAPDLIVIPECPLAYCDAPEALHRTLARGYRLETTFRAFDPAATNLTYDRDDAFFVPLAGFQAVMRPGPNLSIYARHTDSR